VAVGRDLSRDPMTSNTIGYIYSSPLETALVNGPVPLSINSGKFLVEEAFIAYLAIPAAPDASRQTAAIQFWGVASTILNYKIWKEKIGLYDVFAERNLEFILLSNTVVIGSSGQEVI